ncbi:MAG: PQQ-like beta-propeller repeat protein, partial [Actinobacteria bacterium]|nr:PQQ-like beta-propeller repeat protein [Actinomycetota bacterium]
SLPTCRIGPTMTVPLVGSPCRRWAVASPGGERDWLLSDGDLYLTDGRGFVESRTLADGVQRWAVRLGGATQLRAEGQGTLYVTVDDRVLLALGRGDGTLRWEHRIDTAAEELPGAGETIRRVLATTSNVYLQVGATMIALDVDDGSADWSWSEQHVLSAGTSGDRPFVVVVDGVIGLGPTTGEIRWRVPRVTFDNRPHVTSGDDVVIGDDTSHVSLVSGGTGEVRWTRDLGALPVSIAVADDRVTVQGRRGRLWSLGRDDGRIRWAVGATPEPLELLDAGPEMVLAKTRSRPDVVAIDAASGRERWRRAVTGLEDAHLREDGVVIDADGQILAVDVRDGTDRWTLQLSGRVLRAAPDPLLVATAGTLVAIDPPADVP